MHTRLVRFAPLVLAAAAAFLPAAASADQPVREGLPAAPFTLNATICGFPVDVTLPTNKEFITTFTNGKQVVTGALVATLTNDNTGKSMTINISGPGTIVPNGDGTLTYTLSGRSLIYIFPGQVGLGTPGLLLLTSGPVVFQMDSNFNPLSYVVTSASVQDLCVELGS